MNLKPMQAKMEKARNPKKNLKQKRFTSLISSSSLSLVLEMIFPRIESVSLSFFVWAKHSSSTSKEFIHV